MTRSDAGFIESTTFFNANLHAVDPDMAKAIDQELGRQRDEIELIASENIVSRAVLEAQGSILTNKYAEVIRAVAITAAAVCRHRREAGDRARDPAVRRRLRQRAAQSGSQANQAVFLALLQRRATRSWASTSPPAAI